MDCIYRCGCVVHGESVEGASREEVFHVQRACHICLKDARLLHLSRLLRGGRGLKLGLLLYKDRLRRTWIVSVVLLLADDNFTDNIVLVNTDRPDRMLT